MSDEPAESHEQVLARWVRCMNTMARAAHAAGFNGEDAKAAALIYYSSALIIGGKDVAEGVTCLTAAYQFFRNHSQYCVVDISATAQVDNGQVH